MADAGRDPTKTVLVVGATGALGTKICQALLDRGTRVRAMVRASSDRSRLESIGVSDFVVGDMMDVASLRAALAAPVDALIASAAGYTRHSKGDTPETDRQGYRNLVDAAKVAGVPRFVLISILECDHAAEVPHFHDKYLVEQHLAEIGQPYVALRPGAFLDQGRDFLSPGLQKGEFRAFVQGVPFGMVYTPDLARCTAIAATDLPASFLNGHVDIGWAKTYTSAEIAVAFGRVLNRPIRDVKGIPPLMSALFPVVAIFAPAARDMLAMMHWIEAGHYVSRDPARQAEAFGPPPTVDDVARRFCLDHGLLPDAGRA